jgi:hypothetical protein
MAAKAQTQNRNAYEGGHLFPEERQVDAELLPLLAKAFPATRET